MEKTKSTRGKKIAKGVLLALSFILTAVITFSVTLAWFYDGDWASDVVTMAGSVGIELHDSAGKTSGAGNLHFFVLGDKAYPGQAIDCEAAVYNDGGQSTVAGKQGSPAYVRARFVVYTNIGNGLADDSTDPEALMNARAIYDYLNGLITAQNNKTGITYAWQYYTTDKYFPLKNADSTGTLKYYYDGTVYASAPTISAYESYYYLCYPNGATVTKKDNTTTVVGANVLKPLTVGDTANFLWDGEFVIPWTLTNTAADKVIYVAVQFQAIQTFIPLVNQNTSAMDGVISPGVAGDNQLDPSLCTYDNGGVQTIFNSSNFGAIDLKIYEDDGETVKYDFSNGQYNSATSQTNGVLPSTIPAS